MSKNNFEILSARDHVRLRTGMYLGSTSVEKVDRFVLGKWQSTTYVPALLKMVDEILDNSIDEAIRTKFKHANEISVNVQSNKVTITDNGRGIPLDEVVDTETGQKMLRPVAAWTRVRAGTSFEDDRVTIGANGVGSSCVNFMSKLFIGETWQKTNKRLKANGTHQKTNDNYVKITSTNGAEETLVEEGIAAFGTTKTAGAVKVPYVSGTKVEFRPDFSLLGVKNFEEGDHIDLIHDRLNSLQIAFPEIKFKINGKLVKATNIKQYVDLFANDGNSVSVSRPDLVFFFAHSSDGFRQNGYINGVNTRLGGVYNDYIVNNVADVMQTLIKKKYKVEVNRSTIKGGLTFCLFARNFSDPQYDSQTKERLTSSQSKCREHYEGSDSLAFEQVARKLMSCEDIIEPIVEAQVAKKAAADKRAATLAQKKLRRVKVQKHIPASTRNATIFFVEGDSALSTMLEVRDPKTVGGFPLRGVVMNVFDKTPADVLKNKELSEVISVLGLDINDPDSIDNMHYERIATLTDADHDGIGHIMPLLLSFFYKFWPRLFDEGRILITRTPMMISTKGSQVKWFYNYDDARKHKSETKGWYHRYIKGLASLTVDEYRQIINQPVFDAVSIDEKDWFKVMFGKDSEPRKEWIKTGKPSMIK